MIKAVIIEDESLTANRLKRLVEKADSEIEIIALLQTVKETLTWLSSNDEPDLYFMDIQLSDGLSFDIFSAFKISRPVIFTTAYDEYAVKAFKANGIDYLLKPVSASDIETSLQRYRQYNPTSVVRQDIEGVLREISKAKHGYKSNFLVEWRDQLHSIPVSDIAYFQFENKATHLITEENKVHVIASTLDSVEKDIDPQIFFRINRQFIVSRNCISQIHLYFGNRLKLLVKPKASDDATIVSRERVADFKAWLDQ